MAMSINPTTPHARIPAGAIARVGALALVAAVAITVLIYFIGKAIWGYSTEFLPLANVSPTILFTAFFGILAVVVFAIVARVSSRPIPTYRIVALVALVLSFLPDFSLVGTPGASTGVFIALISMHFAAAATLVGTLTTRLPER